MKGWDEVNFFGFMKIKQRLIVSFMVVVVLAAIVGGYGIYQITNISDINYNTYKKNVWTLETLENTKSAFGAVRNSVDLIVASQGDDSTEARTKALNDFDHDVIAMNQSLDNHITRLKEVGTDQETINTYEKIKETFNGDYLGVVKKIQDDVITNNIQDMKKDVASSNDIFNRLDGQLLEDFSASMIKAGALATENKEEAAKTDMILIIICIMVVIVSVLLALIIGNSTANGIARLGYAAKEIADGNLNISLSPDSQDEIGQLTRDLATVVETVNGLMSDLTEVSLQHDAGNIDAMLDYKKYKGIYAEMANNVNTMVAGHITVKRKSIAVITEMVEGNFDVIMEQLPGKKAFINDAIESMRKTIKSVGNEINVMIEEALKGNLSVQADTNKFKGDWVKTMSGLNNVLSGITVPVIESSKVLKEMSKGNLNVKVTGDYKGDLGELSHSLNNSIETISSYVKEVSEILTKLADRNLDVKINRAYIGNFREMKEALVSIVEKFNTVMGEIGSAATQVTTEAKIIAESGTNLAQGAAVQASSVAELTASVDKMNQQTQNNASSAKDASSLSEHSKGNATRGNGQMAEMLNSMKGIKESSENISKIIKVIEDIAFQTNLLALNAAVEAARAGEHGKGFAVVAEEVRNLASRSQTAAKETTQLIEDSIQKVNDGTKVAKETALSLDKIVEDVNTVSGIISNIATSSLEQASSISQILVGLNKISQVIQVNSSTSEESAASAKELSGQAESLIHMLKTFKLKKM